ncbi:CCA tRNA nucleotidyltransferase [Virgibacillus sp. W0181]|uniref:CCA tRNA nucleotidyltransferase n=1 Tax=Virgibacillus sp. W0181 TaxID=3391581 RepID=UPI003F4743B8
MIKSPFLKAMHVIETIEKNNHQAFFVGGCVRDLLLGRAIGDIDIATSASPQTISKIFDSVIPVGIEHGTVIVRHANESFEVTTFRKEGKYSDQRHPDEVQFITNIEEDLKRRDFTINALAMRKDGHIIDLFEAKKDLSIRQIRTVGNGLERFREDPLRIIRALRFVSQLGFFIEEDTMQHMKQVKKEVENLAVERITNEFQKFFAGTYVNKGIDSFIESGVYNYLPIFKYHSSLITRLPKSFHPISSFGAVIALFHKLDEHILVTEWINAWKCSNNARNEAITLVKALTYFENHGLDEWLIYQLPETYMNRFVNLVHILYPTRKLDIAVVQAMHRDLPINSRQQLALKGDELMRLFPNLQKGPWIRRELERLEKQVVFKRLKNENKQLKEWITCHPPEIN